MCQLPEPKTCNRNESFLSFVLGGRAMQTVLSDAELTHYMKNAVDQGDVGVPPTSSKASTHSAVAKTGDCPNVVRIGPRLSRTRPHPLRNQRHRQATSQAGIPVNIVPKLVTGQRPNVIDQMKNKDMALVIKTPFGKTASEDEVRVRTAELQMRIPILTTLGGADAAERPINSLQGSVLQVRALQDYYQYPHGNLKILWYNSQKPNSYPAGHEHH